MDVDEDGGGHVYLSGTAHQRKKKISPRNFRNTKSIWHIRYIINIEIFMILFYVTIHHSFSGTDDISTMT